MPAWLIDLFARYGYAVVFGGVFLENTGLPVPGETALLAGDWDYMRQWFIHVPAVAIVLLWVVAVCDIPLLRYASIDRSTFSSTLVPIRGKSRSLCSRQIRSRSSTFLTP
jgi:hypothetical protein